MEIITNSILELSHKILKPFMDVGHTHSAKKQFISECSDFRSQLNNLLGILENSVIFLSYDIFLAIYLHLIELYNNTLFICIQNTNFIRCIRPTHQDNAFTNFDESYVETQFRNSGTKTIIRNANNIVTCKNCLRFGCNPTKIKYLMFFYQWVKRRKATQSMNSNSKYEMKRQIWKMDPKE